MSKRRIQITDLQKQEIEEKQEQKNQMREKQEQKKKKRRNKNFWQENRNQPRAAVTFLLSSKR